MATTTRRRLVRNLAAAAALGLALFGILAGHGGWRPGAATRDPSAAMSAAADAVFDLRPAGLRERAFPDHADMLATLGEFIGFDGVETLANPLLGERVVIGLEDGGFVAVVPVCGAVHAARIGLGRVFATISGEGRARELALPDGDSLWVAQAPGAWIVADDEDRCVDALDRLAAGASPEAKRPATSGPPDDALLRGKIGETAAREVVDAVRELLRRVPGAPADQLPDPRSGCEFTLGPEAYVEGLVATLSWTSREPGALESRFQIDFASVADRMEDEAAAAPIAPVGEPSDRVRLTIEVSKEGLRGPELRAEVARRMEARAAARAVDAHTQRLVGTRRTAAALRSLGVVDLAVDRTRRRVALSVAAGRR